MKKTIVTFLATCALALGVSSSCLAAGLGFVNVNAVYAAYPGINQISQEINTERARLQDEYNKQSANLGDKEKTALADKLNRQFADFENQKMAPVQRKINRTILTVAKANNIEDVVSSAAMVAGGKDLTQDVIAALK